MNTVNMPSDPPDSLGAGRDFEEFDEVLFDLCQRFNYAGLYREFVRRYSKPFGVGGGASRPELTTVTIDGTQFPIPAWAKYFTISGVGAGGGPDHK